MSDSEKFDFKSFEQEAIERLMRGERLGGVDGIMAPLIKRFLEKAMDGELDHHLLEERVLGNRKNGKGKKQVKTEYGPIDIETSRDRSGTFEPQVLRKRDTQISGGIDEHVISMYAKGMSYTDIRGHIASIYGLDISEAKMTSITDRVMDDVLAWQSRPLDQVYPIVWLDAIHYKVRQDNRVINKAIYNVLGVNTEGHKELLGMYIGENESASFWLNVLDNLKTRGVEDIFISCIDNLSGFKEAIEAIFPKTSVQACVVHQVRNTINYVPYKNSRELVKDVKTVYKAVSLEAAESALQAFTDKWEDKYPRVTQSWNKNWPKLSTYFDYPEEIRRLVYTTNPIESLHSQFRKITKSKRAFTNDKSLMKILYLVQEQVTEKWSKKPIHNWKSIQCQLAIIFQNRIKVDTL